MNLAELFQKLAFGPIGDLAIGGDGTGKIPLASQPKLISKVMTALDALYTRFPIQLKTVMLVTVNGQFVYALRREFAQTSDAAVPVKYLQDTVSQPFMGDVLAIQGVYDSAGLALGLNDRQDAGSWHTMGYDSVSMDYPVAGDVYVIEYRARHALLSPNVADLKTVEVRVPAALETALMAKITAEIYSSMNSDTAMLKAQEFNTKYADECALIDQMNTLNQSHESTNTKPQMRGWP